MLFGGICTPGWTGVIQVKALRAFHKPKIIVLKLGLLINFNTDNLPANIKRVANNL